MAFRRGDHVVAVNTTAGERRAPGSGRVVLSSLPTRRGDATVLAAHEATVSD